VVDQAAYWREKLQTDPGLLRALQAKLPWNRYIPERPTPKQLAFLLVPKLEGLYGGAARGGKTSCLLMGALQYVHRPGYRALLLRRTYGQLNMPDSVLTRAHQWLRGTDARWSAQHYRYEFPSGAVLQFGYLQHFNDVYQYDGAQFHYIAFDELTQFLEEQYRFLFSRLSRPEGDSIPLRMRAATNPGGVGHEWVKARFVTARDPSRFYLPAKLEDNPFVDQDAYRAALSMLDPVTRLQREYGDWDAVRSGTVFKREWFQSTLKPEEAPKRRLRFWDLAATTPKQGRDPDYTVGTLLALGRDNTVTVEDVIRGRYGPHSVSQVVIQTALRDGRQVAVRIEQEPGAAGKLFISELARQLLGYDVRPVNASGPKMLRWAPFASHAQKGLVRVVQGPWVSDWLDELCAVPDSAHDDQADSAAGAFNCLAGESGPAYGVSFLEVD
jgi:predicted phage terminase large subunit-like protein